MLKTGQKPLELPDGTFFQLVTRKSPKEVFNSHITKTVNACLDDSDKTYLPAIDTISSNPFWTLIPIDIDHFKDGHDKDITNAYPELQYSSDLEALLKRLVPGVKVFASAGKGTPKGLILVRGKLTWEDQKTYLTEILPVELRACIDDSERALRRIFVKRTALESISKWLKSIDVVHEYNKPSDFNSIIQDVINNPISDNYIPQCESKEVDTIKLFEGSIDLPGIRRNNLNVKRVLQFALSFPGHAIKGTLTISQKRLARIFGASQQNISVGIESAKKLGYLVKTDSHCPNVKACKYRLTGAARDLAIKVFHEKHGHEYSSKHTKQLLPDSVAPGKWQDFIKSITLFYDTPEEYLLDVFSIDNYDKPGRKQQTIGLWNSTAKKYGKEMIDNNMYTNIEHGL